MPVLAAVPALVEGGELAIAGGEAAIDAYEAYRAVRAAQAAARLAKAAAAAAAAAAATSDTCQTCCKRIVVISKTASPQAAKHIDDAQAAGQPSTLTLDRPGTAARRAASLRGIATAPGMDRDEYPPATFAEGGAGASVRLIPSSDNRSAGGQLGAQLAGATEGCKVTIKTGP